MNRRKFNVGRIIILVSLLGIISVLIFPYAKSETLTWKYGEQFSNLYTASSMIDEIDYYKVINYEDHKAEVLYVDWAHNSGNMFTFTRESQESGWKLNQWKTIWSTSGSANEFMWPMYR